MFRIPFGRLSKNCSKVSRRDALTVGATGLFGGLSLPGLLNLQANAANTVSPKAKSCIFIMLEGGPSHIDMWDLKPDAPAEIRGPFHPISTNVPGTQIGNIMPYCSKSCHLTAECFELVPQAYDHTCTSCGLTGIEEPYGQHWE